MPKLKNGTIEVVALLAFAVGIASYIKCEENSIRKNIKVAVATIYDTDRTFRYTHFRIRYHYSITPGQTDSAAVFRDDLEPECFWQLKGKHVLIVFDSTDHKTNYLIITRSDVKKFIHDYPNTSKYELSPICVGLVVRGQRRIFP